MARAIPPILINATVAQTASVIFCHGIGDTGHGWSDVLRMYSTKMPHVKFILPTAPVRKVTRFGGAPSNAWFDLLGLPDRADEPCQGIEDSQRTVADLVAAEVAAGIPHDRIVLGGFSQGGGLAYFTGLQFPEPLAGLLVLSGYLPKPSTIKVQHSATPVLQCHGTHDPMVLMQWATASEQRAKAVGYDVQFKTYQGLDHSVSDEELKDVLVWLQSRIPQA